MNYRPSGKMCARCVHIDNRDCSRLPFAKMRPMKTDKDGTVVVKCSEFIHLKKDVKP